MNLFKNDETDIQSKSNVKLLAFSVLEDLADILQKTKA